MGAKREHQRFLIKHPIELHAGDHTISGVTVRVSRKGLFVRSQSGFRVGTPVDMVLHLSDEIWCRLTGTVVYSRNIVELKRQNGMGIEFSGMDRKYLDFISSVEKEQA
ncbi:MAG: PilZ domain-containing protein [Nitrospirae bacterium]|nr:PilZ domain-containing protein [Nitrospirota bacterium]